MRKWVGRGSTIDEAVAKGLQELGVTKEEVDIIVLEEPKRRLLGLARTEAVVQLVERAEQDDTESIAQDLNGKVWVKNGQLGYEPPRDGGAAPRLIIDGKITVVYQGQRIERVVELEQGLSGLEIILPEDTKPFTHLDIIVDKDGLTAQLVWQQVPGTKYSLADQPTSTSAQLKLIQESLPPRPITIDDVRLTVQSEGITYGLLLDTINPDIFRAPQGSIVVARGTEPVPPQDAIIEYTYKQQNDIDPDSIRIDHYEVYGISSVQMGTVLARKVPAQAGEPGIDVYGRPIHVPQPKDRSIKCGKGVELSLDGLTATASIAGLPHLNGDILEVLPMLELKSDADISTGNIRFDGAVLIHGNVHDNVKVESISGTVYVGGLVSGATIRSLGTIVVRKNVVSSFLQAGGKSIVHIRLMAILNRIKAQLEKLETAFRTIVRHSPPSTNESALLEHLIDLKFSHLLRETELLSDFFSEIAQELEPKLHEAVARIIVHFGPKRARGTLSLETVRRLLETLAAEEEDLMRAASQDADIRVRYIQNSHLEAAGSVIIEGQEAYYSTVIAGKGFQMERGLFRGGEIIVNDGEIVAKELGGPTGVATSATVVTNGRIKSQLVHSNVTLCIAQQRFRFDEPASRVHAYLSDGVLHVIADGVKVVGG